MADERAFEAEREVGRIHAYLEIGADLVRHFCLKVLPHALPGNPAHHFADQIALGDGMVAALGTRLPPARLGRQIGAA